jgi:hypothetical protein
MSKPTDTNEPSPASAGSRPVAWAALNDDGDIAWIGYTEEGAADGACGRTIVPLYTHPVPPDRPVGLGFDDMRLTDEERRVLCDLRDSYAAEDDQECNQIAEVLDGLLDRTK